MQLLNWLGMALSSFAYLAGLRKWVYQGNLILGLLSVLVFFPLLIATTVAYPAYYLRTLPLVGVGMFLHHYGSRILMQIKLLWFTTLSVLVVQFYFVFFGQFIFAR
ncbi:MAG: hypothetical protein M3Y08_01000 [Fibrobacterota bacterium]|nr:hypothetical protein [Fibrobacterota bacterium]